MKLKVLIPNKVFLVEEVEQVNAEAKNGAFGLLSNHIDFVTALTPSILSYRSVEGKEVFMAIDEGILVKCGQTVMVSTGRAVKDANLDRLHQTVAEEFRQLNEQQKMTRTAIARLESGLARGILEIGREGGEGL
ncbi:putative ATP synthase delta/epsilon subunit [Crocosphaera subtropica ATCC 51142]|uniref:ATP synthase delta/epsilon subunit n=1 Tax=Crocosphaera subtropica (strain ATCC 51142 / BH68) TaxID=43989 RepID=B1WXB7_CROS5|nr:F0F1 ATP synthase subunit epsilon [Crocosphaera subtropica]ACB50861.1 putative ATP synthase delta/epsilon subunit [Crocosphaera subtropica ATCC 51142]